jgi:hypothetical protein
MKIAVQLAARYNNGESDDSIGADAEDKAIGIDQIWGGEGYTKYTFCDNSVLIQSGPLAYGMDADDAASIRGYAAWLGDDEPLERAEIERLLEALS